MSRSYKKHPYCSLRKGKKKKHLASRSIRNLLKDESVVLNYNAYKKAYPSWEICDYESHCTLEEFKRVYPLSEGECIVDSYLRK